MAEVADRIKLENDIYTEWSYKSVIIPDRLKSMVPENAIYIEGLANTPAKDSDNDVIASGNWTAEIIADYMKNALLLYEHDRYTPVGKILEAEGTTEGLFVRGYVTKSWPDYWKVGDDLIKGFSVRVKYDWDNTKYEAETNTWYVAISKLREISICSMPANEDSFFESLKSQFGEAGIKSRKMGITLKSLGEALGFKFDKEPTQEEFVAHAKTALEASKSEGLTEADVIRIVQEAMKANTVGSEEEKGEKDQVVSRNDFDALAKQIGDLAKSVKDLAAKEASKGLKEGEGEGDTQTAPPTETAKKFDGVLKAKVEFKRSKTGM